MNIVPSIGGLASRLLRSRIFWALLIVILVGSVLASAVADKPSVGVVRISGTIDGEDTDTVGKMLRYAETNDAIKAVVLKIDSPGGAAAAAEEIYLDILHLRDKKPVVAVINLWGLSGGYYVAAASNLIYAKPTSMVGSVGAWIMLPQPERQQEDLLSTGPLKGSGGSARQFMYKLEMVKESFARAVISQRGDRLKLSKEELTKAEVYIGIEALRNGLIDEIGTGTDAIKKAADLAGIKTYTLVDINEELNLVPWSYGFQSPETSLDLEELRSRPDLMPTYYYLYFVPRLKE
ncbi:S49 family peptidase [Chloroflexota bacterium]